VCAVIFAAFLNGAVAGYRVQRLGARRRYSDDARS
jgi:hypothetical protein